MIQFPSIDQLHLPGTLSLGCYKAHTITLKCIIGPTKAIIKMIYFISLPWSSSFPVGPLGDSKDSEKLESSGCLTDHDGDEHKLNSQDIKSLKAAQTQFDLSHQHRCCTTIPILDAHEVNFSVTSHLIASTICPICEVCVTSFCPLSFLAQVNSHLSHISARQNVLSNKPVRYSVTWSFTQMLLTFTVNRNNVKNEDIYMVY